MHLELSEENRRAEGVSHADAGLDARRRFGRTSEVLEQCREQRRLVWLENLGADFRFGVRQLRRSPGFAVVAVLMLAFGIGANTAVFGVVRAVLFRPFGYEGEDRLMWLQTVDTRSGVVSGSLSWREMEDVREAVRSFERVGTFSMTGGVFWRTPAGVEELTALQVTEDLIEALRIRPVLGWLVRSGEERMGTEAVVWLSHRLWQSRFGGSPDVLGATMTLDDTVRIVVGVLPEGLEFPLERAPVLGKGTALTAGQHDVWLPLPDPRGTDLTSRGARMYLPLGRLKPGVSEAAARAEIQAVGRRLAVEHPDTNRHWDFNLISLRDQVLGASRQGIVLLAGGVAGVLLVCCVNLANLLLARGLARRREFALRAALGCGRGRLARALLVESLLLAAAGGTAGICLAVGVLRVVRTLGDGVVPFLREAAVDGLALGFAGCLSLMTVAVFGLLPALIQSRAGGLHGWRAGSRGTAGPQVRRWQRGLLVGQIALVLVLLSASGLLLESFRRLLGQDLGYRPQAVLALDTRTPGFDTNGDVCRMFRALRDRLMALPGVTAVGTVSSVPLTEKWTISERPNVVGRHLPEADRPVVEASFVAFDFFQAMGIPLLDGRYFRDLEMDDNGYGRIVILNRSAARLLFPERSAVGGQFTVGSNPDRVLEVVGVVEDTRDVKLEEDPRPRFYWQYPFGGAQVVIRSEVPAKVLLPRVLEVAAAVDSRLRIFGARTMNEIIAATVAERRFMTVGLSAYAGLALAIAAVGVYGVMSYQTAGRRREFGVRVALGATRGALGKLVLRDAMKVGLSGLGIGLVLAVAVNRLIRSQLFGLSAHDPVLLAATCLLLLGVTLLAVVIPARRAGKVDPVEVLRSE